MPLPNEQREYTYEDYLSWPEEERWEIINGMAYNQATPSPVHQRISNNLHIEIGNFLKGRECAVFAAPFTVRLPLEGDETDEKKNKNVIEPDLSIVCDKSKLDKSGYSGAPTLIIEIISKSSVKRDNVLKLNKYQSAMVPEYWIVTPETESVMRYALNEQGHYEIPEVFVFGDDEYIISRAFKELTIKLKDIFDMW